MARNRCPGCGAPYDGRRCRECYYTPFDAAEDSQPYSRELQRPTAQPRIPQREYRSAKWRRSAKAKPWVITVVLLIFFAVYSITGVVFGIIQSTVEELSYMEPEPAALPEDGLVLYEEEGIRLILGWNGGEITGDIPVFLENKTNRDIYACTAGVAVDGCMNEDVFFYVEGQGHTTGKSQLWIDTEEVPIGEITLHLEIVDDESYETLDSLICTFGPGGETADVDSRGEVLFDQDGIKLVYQGVGVNEWDELCLQFYAENSNPESLDLSTSELIVNGEASSHFLWYSLLPHTKAVFQTELYQVSTLGIENAEDIETVDFFLEAMLRGEEGVQNIISPLIEIDTRESR